MKKSCLNFYLIWDFSLYFDVFIIYMLLFKKKSRWRETLAHLVYATHDRDNVCSTFNRIVLLLLWKYYSLLYFDWDIFIWMCASTELLIILLKRE